MDESQYDFYLDLRKYGTVRHAGFGLGFERAVMYITGMENIRDVLPFPRTVNNCEHLTGIRLHLKRRTFEPQIFKSILLHLYCIADSDLGTAWFLPTKRTASKGCCRESGKSWIRQRPRQIIESEKGDSGGRAGSSPGAAGTAPGRSRYT